MPKRRVTCKVIKVSKSSDGTRTETLIENLFDSDTSSEDTISGPSSHAESVTEDTDSLPKITLQIIKKLFPNHCQCTKHSARDDICKKCKASLDYNSSALPCWYRSSYITGLIFKQAIIRLEAEYSDDKQYQHKFLAKFLYMLERYDRSIDAKILFDKPSATADLVKSLFDQLKKKDEGSLTVFQIISNEVIAKVLKINEFSPVKAMSLDLCHLIHLYTWKTISIPKGAGLANALMGKSDKVVQKLTQLEGRAREETARQLYDHFNTVKGMIFNYFLLNNHDYTDVVVWNQFCESLISMFPTMFEFKSNKKDAWLECVLFHISKLFWYNWMRGPDTYKMCFSKLDKEGQESHYRFKYPLHKTSTSDVSFQYIEFQEPVVPRILGCPKHEISCNNCNIKISRGSYLYQWAMGTNMRHNSIIGLMFPREIQYLKRDEGEWDEIITSWHTQSKYERGYLAVCSRKCYIETERMKFPQLHEFLSMLGQMLPDIKQQNSIMENIEEYSVINITNIPGDNASKGTERIKMKLKKQIDMQIRLLLYQHGKIELDGLKDLVLLEYLAIEEEDLVDLVEFSKPHLSWKRYFIPACFHLTTGLNSKIIFACKKVRHYLTDDVLSKLDYEHVSESFTKEMPTRLSVRVCEGTNTATLLSNFKKTAFFDKACKDTKNGSTAQQCKHQILKTLKLVWRKEWMHLYSSSFIPSYDDFSMEMSIETCERLEDLELFSSDKQILHHRQRCMKEVVSVFDLPYCCAFPINNNLVEIKDLKLGHPFIVSDNRQKQHIKSLMEQHDHLVFATNLDLRLQKCAGGIIFFDEEDRTRLCGIILTGWNMYNFLMDFQKLRPFLNSFSIYKRWNFDKSYLLEHESSLVAELNEHNPLESGRLLAQTNDCRPKGIARQKFGALTLCLFKETLVQQEKLHKPSDILANEHSIYSIPFCLKVQGLLNTEAKNSDEEGKTCFLESIIESFGHLSLGNAVSMHTTIWSHHPRCFFARPWICGTDKIPAGKSSDIRKMVHESNAKRDVNCHKCSFEMQFLWGNNDSAIDPNMLIQKCPMEEGGEREFGIARTKTINVKIFRGINPFEGYMVYNEPYKAIFPGNFDLYMLNFQIDPELISADCSTKKPPRNGLKIIVDGESSLMDVLFWGLKKFHCSFKNSDNLKILVQDSNDQNLMKKLIHVSPSACAWVLNDAVGEHFGRPLTLFVHEKNHKKKENSVCSTDIVTFPYNSSMVNRKCFNDLHITSIPHFLNWHGHAYALVQQSPKNKSVAPQINHPLLDHKSLLVHTRFLRNNFSFCHQFDLFVSRCSLETYETTKCCQAVAEVEFFKCKFVMIIRPNRNHPNPAMKSLGDLLDKQMEKETGRGYCVTVGPSLDFNRNVDVSKEFLVPGQGFDTNTMVVIGSQGPKSTPSNGIHYGILRYDIDHRKLQLFIPSNMKWHLNRFEETYNVEEYLTKIIKHHMTMRNDMYGILFYPPELRSDQFVNFKICHIAKFRNELKPTKQGILVFLSMQSTESTMKHNHPDFFNYINSYGLFSIWPHMNQNNLKRKFKRFHELGNMLVTYDDHMCDLVKMDNHMEAGLDQQDNEVVIFTSYSIYDAYSDADPAPHVILTAKMGLNGIFFCKMVASDNKPEVVTVLRNMSKSILGKSKGLGCRGQYSIESVFKQMRAKDNILQNTSNQIRLSSKGNVSEEKQLHIPINSIDEINDAITTATNTSNKNKLIKSISSGDSNDLKQNIEEVIAEMKQNLESTKPIDEKEEQLDPEYMDLDSKNRGNNVSSDETTIKKNYVEPSVALKQKSNLTKICQMRLKNTPIRGPDGIPLSTSRNTPDGISMDYLSTSLKRRCDSCDAEFPKDKHGVIICMKCRTRGYCNAGCGDVGSLDHGVQCDKAQEENNLRLIRELNI